MSLLSLPPVPPELKTIAPFLQRADELKTQDPVIAYWCAYYAAQLGIALKLKDNAARMFLLHLLEALEKMKSEIGPNDAIDDELASSAYVENFALRVFAAADNEDRKGNATRGTAKKFLAAANFLEVLSVFTSTADAPATTINVQEKIRYAKWKAADIARAFREGRKPTPGGADEVQPEEASPEPTAARPDSTSPPAIHRATPPPGFISDLPPTSPPADTFVVPSQGPADPTSPDAWSTLATPGASGYPLGAPGADDLRPRGSALKNAWVSDELEGKTEEEIDEQTVLDSAAAGSPTVMSSEPKSVRFTPSVTGGLTPSVVEPHSDPFMPSSPPPPHDLPTGYVPSAPSFDQTSPYAPPNNLPPGFIPRTHQPSVPPPPPPASSYPTPPMPILSHQPAHIPPPVEATITPAVEDLSPSMITKIQKHCKFAISALDYEDAETARKELRAALKMLGG
ncbi:Vta1 like-domain-containing protein [Phanerochaete sordida]|uniref:Vta1 like-domain-containing protein n=1 Tax=Phanerochaete sordida TaxID=48140 RepID=A0A9P3GQ26_9APHY|nr:Vta1 like-domain-containing protein [Phanerochaete sordida]